MNQPEQFTQDMADNNQGHSLSNDNFTEEFLEEEPIEQEEEKEPLFYDEYDEDTPEEDMWHRDGKSYLYDQGINDGRDLG